MSDTRRTRSVLWVVGLLCLVALLIGMLLSIAPRGKIVRQTSGGMAPTINAGEEVVVDYTAYDSLAPERWDVVMIRPPILPDMTVLKRVIAKPSEVVSLTVSGIVVNSSLLELPAGLSNVVYCAPENTPTSVWKFVSFPYQVPAAHYFVVGDNWTNSLDSRQYGAVPETNILGKVMIE